MTSLSSDKDQKTKNSPNIIYGLKWQNKQESKSNMFARVDENMLQTVLLGWDLIACLILVSSP